MAIDANFNDIYGELLFFSIKPSQPLEFQIVNLSRSITEAQKCSFTFLAINSLVLVRLISNYQLQIFYKFQLIVSICSRDLTIETVLGHDLITCVRLIANFKDALRQSLLEYTATIVERQRRIFVKRGPTRYTLPYGEMTDFYIHSVICQKVTYLANI